MKNVIFRPFSVEKDRDTICAFLRDTKESVGDMVDDHAADCECYMKALLATQKRDKAFCRAEILDVSRNNSKAIRFYENHGWEFTGKEHGCHLQMKKEI